MPGRGNLVRPLLCPVASCKRAARIAFVIMPFAHRIAVCDNFNTEFPFEIHAKVIFPVPERIIGPACRDDAQLHCADRLPVSADDVQHRIPRSAVLLKAYLERIFTADKIPAVTGHRLNIRYIDRHLFYLYPDAHGLIVRPVRAGNICRPDLFRRNQKRNLISVPAAPAGAAYIGIFYFIRNNRILCKRQHNGLLPFDGHRRHACPVCFIDRNKTAVFFPASLRCNGSFSFVDSGNNARRAYRCNFFIAGRPCDRFIRPV